MNTWICVLCGFLTMSSISKADLDPFAKPTYGKKDYGINHATGFVPQKGNSDFWFRTPRISFVGATAKVPAKFSLKGKTGPIEDQGQCGSCWDFALTTALRGSLIGHGKDPGRLSFNYLLNCDKGSQGCSGGDFTAAKLLIAPQGAPKYGSDGYYNAFQGKCQVKPAQASAQSYVLLGDDGGLFPNAPMPSFQDIAYAVSALHQPVAIDIAVDDYLQQYSWGTYNTCSNNDPKNINHMVVIEGYDCEKSVDKDGNCIFDAKGNLPNGVGKWIIRNSWGYRWGSSGYITMKATNSKGQKCDAAATDALIFDIVP